MIGYRYHLDIYRCEDNYNIIMIKPTKQTSCSMHSIINNVVIDIENKKIMNEN